jgi:hypothetical protein
VRTSRRRRVPLSYDPPYRLRSRRAWRLPCTRSGGTDCFSWSLLSPIRPDIRDAAAGRSSLLTTRRPGNAGCPPDCDVMAYNGHSSACDSSYH